MTDVFISYSRKDKSFVERLSAGLSRANRDTWVDWEDIPRAADWLQEIFKGIDEAYNFIFVISANSLTSEVCTHEVRHAIEQKKRIIPLIFQQIKDDVLVTVRGKWMDQSWEQIARDNWKHLQSVNWLMFDDEAKFDTEFAALLKTIEQDYEHIQAHTRYTVQSKEWDKRHRDRSSLLIGTEIEEAENWLRQADTEHKDPPSTDAHRAYITESRRVEDERLAQAAAQVRRIQQFRRAAALLGIVGFLAVVLSVFAFSQATNAGNQAATATVAQGQALDAQQTSAAQVATVTNQVATAGALLTAVPPTLAAVATQVQEGENRIESLRLAALANGILQQPIANPETAALLGIRALKTAYAEQADAALVRSTDRLHTLARLAGHTNRVRGALQLVDGRLLSWSRDTTLRLWDADGQPLRALEGHTSIVNGALQLADGRLLSWSDDATLRLWDADGQPLNTLEGHTSIVNGALQLADGRLLSWSFDATALRLWDADGQPLRTLEGHTDIVRGALQLADGRLLSWSDDATLRLWDADYSDFITFACTRVFRDLTPQERQQYGIADSEPTCPQFAAAS